MPVMVHVVWAPCAVGPIDHRSFSLVPAEIGETSGRIEARPAKPIDGKVAPDEGGRLAIPDDCIVFDVQGHAPAPGGQDSSQDLS